MAPRKAYGTNVFEASIGDGSVQASRRGEMLLSSPEVADFIRAKRAHLGAAHLAGHSFECERKPGGMLVEAKFAVLPAFRSLDKDGMPVAMSFGLTVVRNGEFNSAVLDRRRKSAAHVLNLARDHDALAVARSVAAKAEGLVATGPTVFSSAGEWCEDQVETRVMDRLRKLLEQDVDAANKRLEKAILTVASSSSFAAAAKACYHDAVRDQVHGALKKFVHLDPDVLHRFVDELYVKKIHDS